MQIDAETIGRLGEQSELLLRMYQLELAKDPSSRASESSRSNMIALRHSIAQIYGEAASRGLLFQADPGRETAPIANPPATSQARLFFIAIMPPSEKPVSRVEDCQRHHDLNHVGNRHLRLPASGDELSAKILAD